MMLFLVCSVPESHFRIKTRPANSPKTVEEAADEVLQPMASLRLSFGRWDVEGITQ